ncbi:TPA: endonuclease/exonuclease/phosphatase family protein [Bacillus cereus]|uniref:endonuclease/exonuclease/phosphatase family protein n=1 Tax=Bacillus cereus TaxID=1396 RepID=UPI000279224D|nr:endonuclease/exonuclease/phosphatase family protein [Bacillus cereus]EJQ27392.1 hypothetical protein IE5_00171 [Bacillus cereus BAG3X2-2]
MQSRKVTSNDGCDDLKVLLWNIQCTAGFEYGNDALLPILEGIELRNKKLRPDIIVLNEYYQHNDYWNFKNKLESAGYSVFEDRRDRKKGVNQVLICVNSDKFEGIEKAEINNPNSDKMPNFLSVTLQYKGSPFVIIGTRIRTEKDFNERKNQFNELVKLVDDLKERGFENILIAGDFNHARILGDENAYLTRDEINEAYTGKLQKVFNYHSIKLKLKEMGFNLCTPSGNSISFLKLDHLFLPNLMTVEDEIYVFKKGLSDHAQLRATIKI